MFLHQPLAFFGAHGDAFEIVVADRALEEAGIEVRGLEPALGRADRHRVRRMGMDDGVRVRQALVEHRMLGEPGEVHRVGTVADLVPLAVDLDEVAGGHLLPQQSVGVDEEGIVLTRNAQGDVVVDAFAPAEVSEDAIAGGKVLPRLPFGLAARDVGLELGRHGFSPFVANA